MDPLSIIASVVGIAAAGLQASTALRNLSTKYREHSLTINTICTQSKLVGVALKKLEVVFRRKSNSLESQFSAEPDLVDALDEVLTGCNAVFVCLEEETRKLDVAAYKGTRHRGWKEKAKIVWNADAMVDLLQKIRAQHGPIILLIQLLTLDSLETRNNLLQKNTFVFEDTAKRTRSLRTAHPKTHIPESIFRLSGDGSSTIADDASTIGGTEFGFDEELINTRAYRNAFKSALSNRKQHQPQTHNVAEEISNTSEGQDSNLVSTSVPTPTYTTSGLETLRISSPKKRATIKEGKNLEEDDASAENEGEVEEDETGYSSSDSSDSDNIGACQGVLKYGSAHSNTVKTSTNNTYPSTHVQSWDEAKLILNMMKTPEDVIRCGHCFYDTDTASFVRFDQHLKEFHEANCVWEFRPDGLHPQATTQKRLGNSTKHMICPHGYCGLFFPTSEMDSHTQWHESLGVSTRQHLRRYEQLRRSGRIYEMRKREDFVIGLLRSEIEELIVERLENRMATVIWKKVRLITQLETVIPLLRRTAPDEYRQLVKALRAGLSPYLSQNGSDRERFERMRKLLEQKGYVLDHIEHNSVQALTKVMEKTGGMLWPLKRLSLARRVRAEPKRHRIRSFRSPSPPPRRSRRKTTQDKNGNSQESIVEVTEENSESDDEIIEVIEEHSPPPFRRKQNRSSNNQDDIVEVIEEHSPPPRRRR